MNHAFIGSCLLSVVFVQQTSAAEFKANWAGAKMEVAGKEIKTLRVKSPLSHEHVVGQRRFQVLGNSVHEVDATDGKKRWTVKVDDGLQLRWLDASEGVAYLLSFRRPPVADSAESGSTIRPLDLRTRQWLPPMVLPKTKLQVEDGRREEDVVGHLLATDKATFVMVYGIARSNKPHAQPNADGYRICCFAPGAATPKWIKEFAWAGAKSGFGPQLFSNLSHRSQVKSIQPLTVLREDILAVCAGEAQDLIALDTESGGQRWSIPRIWEFERGFVGPSVYEHFMSRFGLDYFDVDAAESVPDENDTEPEKEAIRAQAAEAKVKIAAARKTFDDQFAGAILAGPMAPSEGGRFFVAVARGRKGPTAGYTSNCVVYQVDDEGQIEACVTLPRMVEGWPQKALAGGIVWTCGRGSLVRIGAAEPDFSHGFLDAEDCLCSVQWYREYSFRREETWLSSDAKPSAAAFNDRFLIRTLDGGYIRKKEERLFRFPINAVRLADGSRQDFLLTVPFEGNVPWPQHGVSAFLDVSAHAHGPYFLYVNDFEIDGNRLRVMMKRDEGEAAALDFELSEVLK